MQDYNHIKPRAVHSVSVEFVYIGRLKPRKFTDQWHQRASPSDRTPAPLPDVRTLAAGATL